MKKHIFFGLILFSQLNNPLSAELKTREEADRYLDKYCIEIVNFTKDLVESQVKLAAQEKWKEFFEHGAMISGASNIYSNFCK